MIFRLLVTIVTIIYCSTYCSTAVAQVRISGAITLRDAISATLEANPQLGIYPLREESIAGQKETASLSPPLTFNTSVENALGSGDLSGVSGAETTLSLSRIVELGDKRDARINVVNRRVDLLDAELQVQELDLLTQTTMRFIDVVAAQERVILQRQAREIAGQTVTLLEPLVEAGQTPVLELMRARAAQSRAETAERFAQASLDSARIRLSSMWGTQNPEYDQADADLFSVGEAGSLTALLIAIESNPDMAVFASEHRLREAQLQEARAQQESNIQWTAGIRHLQELNDTGLVFSVSVPLFNNKRATGAIRSARANSAEIEQQKKAALNQMRGQLHTLYLQLEQAVIEVNVLQQDVLPQLSNVVTLTRDAFESGRYSYVELISAQREYLDAEMALINITASAHRLRAEIERLSGEALSGR